MYGLPHAGKITSNRLMQHLAPYGYTPVKHTSWLWQHKTRLITFAIVIDDFGINYTDLADANHLQSSLLKQYNITTDMTGPLYRGLTLTWNYDKSYIDVSMPDYIKNYIASTTQHQTAHENRLISGTARCTEHIYNTLQKTRIRLSCHLQKLTAYNKSCVPYFFTRKQSTAQCS